MRKSIRRIVALTFAVLLLCSLFPFSCFAVDPVSAATMANALAQAITAYGASNGVSMMYDVSSADGIGEAMHDLWGQFKTDVNDNNVPTYDSLAVTIWSTVFKKVGNNVAINLSDTTVSYLDAFWNWLLSGPAEMTKVDNQYYEWTLNQNNSVDPISVISIVGYPVAVIPSAGNNASTFSSSSKVFYDGGQTLGVLSTQSCIATYFAYPYTANSYTFAIVSTTQINYNAFQSITLFDNRYYGVGSNYVTGGNLDSTYNVYVYTNRNSGTTGIQQFYCPVYSSLQEGIASSASSVLSPDSVFVQPYVGDEAPQDVYIPDNDDVNYQPLPYVGPLDIPWDQTWGDGETITDAQGTSIADALDNAIADDGTLTLEGDEVDNPPAGDQIGGPDSYQVPGLADVFPFCIPFDIYNFLSAFAAQPTAPYFEAELAFPEAIGGTQTIEIDFDTPTWNQLAQLLRLLELLAFIVGLALLTRSMFIRG